MNRPWGISCIQDIYHPDAGAGLPDGRWVAAVAVPYPSNLLERLRAAWWVLTGRAQAMLWPKAGDLEGIWKRKAFVEPDRQSRPFQPMAVQNGTRPPDFFIREFMAHRHFWAAKDLDLVARKDGQEYRLEADWLKPFIRSLAPVPSQGGQVMSGGIVGGVSFGEGLQAAQRNSETAA